MAKNDPHIEEIFIDPAHTLKRPNEVVFKLAFNEDGDIGLITSYQDVGDELVFIGVSLSANKVWLCKSPLVIKAALDPAALQNITNIFSSVTGRPAPGGAVIFEQGSEGPQIINGNSIDSFFQALRKLRGIPQDPAADEKYFGHPDFSNFNKEDSVKFNFNMDSFLEAFDDTGEEDELPETDPLEDNDPDGLG